MTKATKTYYNCAKKRAKIEELLRLNASYQAQHISVNNTSAEKARINRHCNREFLFPIREIDPKFYDSIKIQDD
tara:strand:+ start:272 stop:493 length:222 start_codon:yes stop_codon:yes gene_type:complete